MIGLLLDGRVGFQVSAGCAKSHGIESQKQSRINSLGRARTEDKDEVGVELWPTRVPRGNA